MLERRIPVRDSPDNISPPETLTLEIARVTPLEPYKTLEVLTDVFRRQSQTRSYPLWSSCSRRVFQHQEAGPTSRAHLHLLRPRHIEASTSRAAQIWRERSSRLLLADAEATSQPRQEFEVAGFGTRSRP